ncbi:hypothetical protein [Oricola sp.]|uniref:hypothetical protein n=1 Tax=Oricola sp. TaxID=1979950 RepID=UPI003BABC2AE
MHSSTLIVTLLMVLLVLASVSIIGPYIGVVLGMGALFLSMQIHRVVNLLPFLDASAERTATSTISSVIYVGLTALFFVFAVNRMTAGKPGGVAMLNIGILMAGMGISFGIFWAKMADFHGL